MTDKANHDHLMIFQTLLFLSSVDFGLCEFEYKTRQRPRLVGSPFWIAPEVVCKKPYGYGVDIWSLGVCLVEIANRRIPDKSSSLRVCLFFFLSSSSWINLTRMVFCELSFLCCGDCSRCLWRRQKGDRIRWLNQMNGARPSRVSWTSCLFLIPNRDRLRPNFWNTGSSKGLTTARPCKTSSARSLSRTSSVFLCDPLFLSFFFFFSFFFSFPVSSLSFPSSHFYWDLSNATIAQIHSFPVSEIRSCK